jgi:hypothetical protein
MAVMTSLLKISTPKNINLEVMLQLQLQFAYSAPSLTPNIVDSAKSLSVSTLSSPATGVPIEYQQKLCNMEAKLQQYQSLKEKLNCME